MWWIGIAGVDYYFLCCVCVCVHACVCMRACACVRACMCACVCMCVYVRVCVGQNVCVSEVIDILGKRLRKSMEGDVGYDMEE